MSSKRKFTSLGIERRVRARREEEWEPEPDLSEESEDDGVSGKGEEEDDDDVEEEDDDSGADSDPESEESGQDDAPKVDFTSISFGALARAQASLPPSERERKRKTAGATPSTAAAPSTTTTTKSEPLGRREEKPSEREGPPKRSSKHAPQEITSKRRVSRRREILADPRPKFRDPRFDPLAGKLDEAKIARNYAFLDEYRDNEMAELRKEIKKTKNLVKKEELKRELLSMESKKKARQKKEDEANILAEHRRKEKELVAQGKKPFYLRKSEQKKQVLMNRYADMSKSQVDKAIERKRKKVASKEKKELASLERVQRRH